jgi:hypothetical protein
MDTNLQIGCRSTNIVEVISVVFVGIRRYVTNHLDFFQKSANLNKELKQKGG